MTYEEALEYAKSYITLKGIPIDSKEATKCIVEALEKQVPKNPDIEGDGYWNGELVYDTWICPCCGEHYEIEFEKYNYCPKCGQRIDLSEVE